MKKRTKFIPDEKFWADNGKEFPEVILKKRGQYNWSNYNSLEDFQKLIDYLNIFDNFGDLRKISHGFQLKAEKYKDSLKFKKNRRPNWSMLNTILDFQNFIDTHPDILSARDFDNKYRGVYDRAVRLKLTKELKYKGRSRQDYSNLNSIEDFQSFIDNHPDITQVSDLASKYIGVYARARKLGIHKKLVYKNRVNDYSNYNTLEDFQNLLDTNLNLNNPSDFKKYSEYLYGKMCSLGYASQLNYRDYNRKSWINVITNVNDIIKFIKDNNIVNSSDFNTRFPGATKRITSLGIKASEYNSHFTKPNKSQLEIQVERFLLKNNIDFKSEVTFSDLGKLRYDFWLEKYNLMLEPGGEQHIIQTKRYGEDYFKTIKKNDLRKYNYCIDKGITIIYWFKFTPPTKEKAENELKTNGYHGEYYLDFDEFCNRILEIVGQKK